jgi:hypothetical protein
VGAGRGCGILTQVIIGIMPVPAPSDDTFELNFSLAAFA